MKSIAPNFGQRIDFSCLNLNRLRLNVAAFAIKRDRSCKRCKAPLSQYHALIECTKFEETRTQLETQLRKENLDLTETNILKIHKNSITKSLANQLIQEIDNIFNI